MLLKTFYNGYKDAQVKTKIKKKGEGCVSMLMRWYVYIKKYKLKKYIGKLKNKGRVSPFQCVGCTGIYKHTHSYIYTHTHTYRNLRRGEGR